MRIKYLAIITLLSILASCTSTDLKVIVKDPKRFQKRITIAVLPFKDAAKHPGSGVNVADALASELIRIKNFDLIERTQVKKVLSEQSMDATGLTETNVDRIGKLLKADYIVLGSVSDYSYERKYYIVPKTKLTFNIRVVDVKRGRIDSSIRFSRETGKNALVGCCLLGWFYVPYAMMSDENINDDITDAVEDIVEEIEDKIKD